MLQRIASKGVGIRVGATVALTTVALSVSQFALATMADAAGCGYGDSGCPPPKDPHPPKHHRHHGHRIGPKPHSYRGPIHHHHVVGHVLHGTAHVLVHARHGLH